MITDPTPVGMEYVSARAAARRPLYARCAASAALVTGVALCASPPVRAELTAPTLPVTPYEALSQERQALFIGFRPSYDQLDVVARSELNTAAPNSWRSPSFNGLSASFELNPSSRFVRSYMDAQNSMTPQLATGMPDPMAIKRLTMDYEGYGGTTVRFGTQDMNIEPPRPFTTFTFNQRLVPFAGLAIENKVLPNTTLYGAHMWRVMTPLGDLRQTSLDTVRATYQWKSDNRVMAYGYANNQVPTLTPTMASISHQTYGLRADGAYPMNESLSLLYIAEYAWQNPTNDSERRITANYRRTGAGLAWGEFFARADFETLGSVDGAYGFQAPTGTNHMSAAWSDVFVTIPQQGLQAALATLGANFGAVRWTAQFRDLRSDVAGVRYRSQIDLGMSYALSKTLSARVEYADLLLGDDRALGARRLFFGFTLLRGR